MRIRLHSVLTLVRETNPARTNRELLFLALLSLVMQVAPMRVCAQGTITLDFSGLPPNEVLGEQFAAQGFHFFRRNSQAMTVTAPSALQPDGGTVGYTDFDVGIRFDSPITSLRLDVAELNTRVLEL